MFHLACFQVITDESNPAIEVSVKVTFPNDLDLKKLELVLYPINPSSPVTIQGLAIELCGLPSSKCYCQHVVTARCKHRVNR